MKLFLLLTFNLFHATGLFQYPLKTWENQRFFIFPGGYWNRPVAYNELTHQANKHGIFIVADRLEI